MSSKPRARVKLDWSRMLGFDQVAIGGAARDLSRIGPKVGAPKPSVVPHAKQRS